MPLSPRTRTSAMITGGTVTVALLLGACGSHGMDHDAMAGHHQATASATASGTAQAAGYNPADVTFATEMIPHHQQALQMTQLAATHANNSQVKDLAGRISSAQRPEITVMSTWLAAWGQPVPGEMDHANMPGMSAAPMPGMMTTDQMRELAAKTGTDFDRAFLQMMISHHQGAITMANTEQTNGSSQDAKALAASIVRSQTAEITEMQTLLTKL